jgi:hypothetical protein
MAYTPEVKDGKTQGVDWQYVDWCDGCEQRRPGETFSIHLEHGVRCRICNPKPLCHCGKESVTNLDGDELCYDHANEWVRNEGIASLERDRDYPLTYENYRG